MRKKRGKELGKTRKKQTQGNEIRINGEKEEKKVKNMKTKLSGKKWGKREKERIKSRKIWSLMKREE